MLQQDSLLLCAELRKIDLKIASACTQVLPRTAFVSEKKHGTMSRAIDDGRCLSVQVDDAISPAASISRQHGARPQLQHASVVRRMRING